MKQEIQFTDLAQLLIGKTVDSLIVGKEIWWDEINSSRDCCLKFSDGTGVDLIHASKGHTVPFFDEPKDFPKGARLIEVNGILVMGATVRDILFSGGVYSFGVVLSIPIDTCVLCVNGRTNAACGVSLDPYLLDLKAFD